MRCPSCDTRLPDTAKFCSECGTDLRSPRGPETERKIITALFCDVVGSTGLGDRLDPEELDTLLARYFEMARRCIEDAGGVVEKFIGDAVVGLFGLSVAHEDDASRAVGAALAVVDDVRSILDFQIRIAVNTGEALVRPFLDPTSGGAVATGDCLNVAARLQATAPPMGVIAGERTRAAATSFDFERLPDVEVKGKSEPVAAWRVLGRSSRPIDTRHAGPFVGREKELASLRDSIDRLAVGEGAIVVIEGEPGIGKSRLVRELRGSSPDVRWMTGRSIETRDAAGYRPFAEQIRAWIGREPATWSALREAAARVSLSPSELPFLATIADIDVPADIAQRLEALDAEAVRPQIYRGSRAWLDALSASAPLVLEFEDWHWADGASANLLRHVLPLVARRSLLVLVVTRPGASPPIGSLLAVERDGIAQRFSALTLASLPQDDATALLDALVGSGIKEGRRRAAQDRAEGNPYFITELARFLQEQPDAGLALPDSIRAVVTSRVDRLDPDVRTSLRRAAVIGRTFTFALLDRLGADVRPALERLVQTGLVERVDRGATYRFAHALTRDAVYEGIPMSERRGLHGLIAETYRWHDGATAPDDLPAVAYHLAKAERWDEAVEALTAAGEQAARLASDDEALDRYREAIRAHERLPEERWSPLERSTIERRVAETLERLGRHEEAKAQVETALGRLGVRMPTARPAVRRALARQLLPRLLGPPALPAPGSRTDPAALEIDRQLDLLGFISYFLDADDYALATLMLTNRAVRARDLYGIAAGAVRAVFVFNALGRVRLTERYAQRAVEAAARLDDPVAVARILAQAGFHTFLARGSIDAIADLRRGMDAGERAGDLRSWGTAATLLSWAMTNAGQLDEARSLAELIRDTGANGGERQVEGWGVTTAGYVAFHAGRADEGLRLSTEGREILRSVPDILAALTVTGGITRDHLWLGDVEAARAELQAGREQAAATGIRGFAVAILNEAEAELRMLALARERTRANERAAASIVRRSRRHARTCRWHAVHAEAMDGCRSWLVGRRDRARTSFARFEKLVDELACEGIGSAARRWIVHCCQTAGIEPPTLVVGAQRRDGSRG